MDQYYTNFPEETLSLGSNHNMIFNNLRQKKEGFNVEIQITGKNPLTSFKAHKRVLLMFSPEFFKTLFSDRWNTDEKPKVENPELQVVQIGAEHANPAFFGEILDFMYTGSITFRPANIQAVLATAHYLQLKDLLEHGQAYFERMLNNKPEVERFRIYNHITIATSDTKVTTQTLPRFGTKLYVFESTSGNLTIIVKSIPDNRWMFADSIEFVETVPSLDDADLYLCDKNYIILHQTPTRRLNSLPVTLGTLYYCGQIMQKAYVCGSEPLGGQYFNLNDRKFAEFPLPARGVNRFVNLVSSEHGMIIVVEGEYLNIIQVAKSGKWQEYQIPQNKFNTDRKNLPLVGLGMPEFDVRAPRLTRTPIGAVEFYSPAGKVEGLWFDSYNKVLKD